MKSRYSHSKYGDYSVSFSIERRKALRKLKASENSQQKLNKACEYCQTMLTFKSENYHWDESSIACKKCYHDLVDNYDGDLL